MGPRNRFSSSIEFCLAAAKFYLSLGNREAADRWQAAADQLKEKAEGENDGPDERDG